MAIQISSDGRTFTLQTEKSSYQMMADAHDVLLHLYYGRKIAAENLEERIFRSDVGFAGNPPEAGEDRTYSLLLRSSANIPCSKQLSTPCTSDPSNITQIVA